MKKFYLVNVCVISVLFLCTGCASSQNTSASSHSEIGISSANTNETESITNEYPTLDTTNESDSSEDVTEVDSLESAPESAQLSIDEFISKIPSVIDGTVGFEDSIDDISLENGNLIICVTLGDPSPFSYEDLMISRTSSITDQILFLENCFGYWETITIDFGEHGYIQNGHDNIQNDGYGAYFRQENFVISTNH